MPHQCTNCERVFPDGSKEMLSGCPDCGGNKFQFKPDSATETPTLDDSPNAPTAAGSSASSEPPVGPDSASESDDVADADAGSKPPVPDVSPTSDASAPGSATTDTGADYIEAESDPSVLDEDTAQADARSDVVSPEELDDASSPPPSAEDAARTVPPDSAESPGIDDLRAELNDQFESIKILNPGQYELNLMELYDRQECIISLQEDGHYVIEVADTWRDDGP
ncbi:Zn-ribbon containing protein [Haloplanus litoreus]|uniref:Zn-ribbon containing protein n=1 Tax=Haloplanus litoreus TaxID=767515 RepID=A0ABD5ZVK7_9EURY